MHRQNGVHHHLAAARVAARQTGGLGRHHQPHDGGRQRLAHTHAVAADQVALQGVELVFVDALVRQFAEAGVHAINRRVAISGRLDQRMGGADIDAGRFGQAQLAHAGVDEAEFIQRDLAGVENHRSHIVFPE